MYSDFAYEEGARYFGYGNPITSVDGLNHGATRPILTATAHHLTPWPPVYEHHNRSVHLAWHDMTCDFGTEDISRTRGASTGISYPSQVVGLNLATQYPRPFYHSYWSYPLISSSDPILYMAPSIHLPIVRLVCFTVLTTGWAERHNRT